MAHYKLILAYDGSAFHGFQRQAGRPSVQACFEEALRQLGWSERAVIPAGRTDTGVHALGQVVSFHLDWKHGDDKLQRALNAFLPPELSVQAVIQVQDSFHPRYDALQRDYRYRLYPAEARDPFRDRFAWRINRALDMQSMQQASRDLLGEHDFKAFGRALMEGGTTVRRIDQANWFRKDDEWQFDICGNAFLYHMVRRIVWHLVRIGLGELPPDTVRTGLESGSTGIVALAPACGLTLMRVHYAEDLNKNC